MQKSQSVLEVADGYKITANVAVDFTSVNNSGTNSDVGQYQYQTKFIKDASFTFRTPPTFYRIGIVEVCITIKKIGCHGNIFGLILLVSALDL